MEGLTVRRDGRNGTNAADMMYDDEEDDDDVVNDGRKDASSRSRKDDGDGDANRRVLVIISRRPIYSFLMGFRISIVL